LREQLKKQENEAKVLAFFKFTPFCGMQEILAVFAKMHSATIMPVARKNYFKTFLVVCKIPEQVIITDLEQTNNRQTDDTAKLNQVTPALCCYCRAILVARNKRTHDKRA